MEGTEAAKACSTCSRLVRSRCECTQCGKVLCDMCSAITTTLNDWFDEHKAEFPFHKTFRSIAPPNLSRPLSLDRDCDCVSDGEVMAHCGRCLDRLSSHTETYLSPADFGI